MSVTFGASRDGLQMKNTSWGKVVIQKQVNRTKTLYEEKVLILEGVMFTRKRKKKETSILKIYHKDRHFDEP